MAEGTLLTGIRFTVLDATGVAVSGAQIATYVAGTSTPLTTYSDVALTVPNTNPTIADSAGRAVIFLQPMAYKVVVSDASGVLLYSQDHVVPNGAAGTGSARITIAGRLTGVAGSAVADVTSGTSIYYTPYLGNQIGLYDGTSWTTITFVETSLALGVDAANTNYDLFGYSNNGTFALERLAWSSDTLRATGLSWQDGVYVKSGDATRRYLGTYRTTAAQGRVSDNVAVRGIWNYYHRVTRTLERQEIASSWTYSTGAWRTANNNTANKVEVVIGVGEVAILLAVFGLTSSAAATGSNDVSIGEDSPTAPLTGYVSGRSSCLTIATVRQARIGQVASAGYHYYAWLEFGSGGTDTWFGDTFAGLIGSIEG